MKTLCFSLLLTFFVNGLPYDYDDTQRVRVTQRRCPRPINLPNNLQFITQGKMRTIRYICPENFIMIGKRFSTCLRGRWSSPPPICIASGCTTLDPPQNGRLTETYNGAMAIFGCNPGYVQNGSTTLYCDGVHWNDSSPICIAPTTNPKVECNFEDADICGWTHDVTHDFEWKRSRYSTPSGHVNTGPSFDHTLGKGYGGYYMYLEASAPRVEGDVTRLFSPVYPAAYSGSCFSFWYHMYGEAIGSLRVYVKGENQVLAELSPAWILDGEQGEEWLKAQINVVQMTTPFQIIMEGVRGSDHRGDSAFDDVLLVPQPCPTQNNTQQGSCRIYGCNVPTMEGQVCSCSMECQTSNLCCSDYWDICNGGILPNTSNAGQDGTSNQTESTSTRRTESLNNTTLSVTNSTPSEATFTESEVLWIGPNISSTTQATEVRILNTTSATVQVTSVPVNQSTGCSIDGNDFSATNDSNLIISLYNCTTELVTEGATIKPTVVVLPQGPTSTAPPSKATVLPTSPAVTQTVSRTRYIFYTRQTTSTTTPNIITTISNDLKSSRAYTQSTQDQQLYVTTQPPMTSGISRTSPKPQPTQRVSVTPQRVWTTRKWLTSPKSPFQKTSAIPKSPAPITTTLKPTRSPPISTIPYNTKATRPRYSLTTKNATFRVPTQKPTSKLSYGTTTKISVSTPQKKPTKYPQSKPPFILVPTTAKPLENSTKSRKPFFFNPTVQVNAAPSSTDIDVLFPDEGDSERNEKVVDDSSRLELFPRRSHPLAKSQSNLGIPLIVSLCLVAIFSVALFSFATFFLARRRQKRRIFENESEMRFIPQSEELEISLADNTESMKLI